MNNNKHEILPDERDRYIAGIANRLSYVTILILISVLSVYIYFIHNKKFGYMLLTVISLGQLVGTIYRYRAYERKEYLIELISLSVASIGLVILIIL